MILILILLILIQDKAVLNLKSCNLNLHNAYLQIVENIQNFSELNFTNCNNKLIKNVLIIFPKKKLLLDNSLNFKQISLYSKQLPLFVMFRNLKGFDLESNPFKTLTFIDSRTNKINWFNISRG